MFQLSRSKCGRRVKAAGLVGLVAGASLVAGSVYSHMSDSGIPSMAQITVKQVAPDAALPEWDESGLPVSRESRAKPLAERSMDSVTQQQAVLARAGIAWRSEYSGKSGHLQRTVMCVQFANPKLGGDIDLSYTPVGGIPKGNPSITLENPGEGVNQLNVATSSGGMKNVTINAPKTIQLTDGLACLTVNYNGPAISDMFIDASGANWHHPNPGTGYPDNEPTYENFNDAPAEKLIPSVAQAAQKQRNAIPNTVIQRQIHPPIR